MPNIIHTPTHQMESTPSKKEAGVFFFFVYNMENYYHFLYDTLPYLDEYFHQKSVYPECKLLLPDHHKWLPFQRETFSLLGIREADIAYAKEAVYETLILSSSKTHGKTEDGTWASNMPASPTSIWKKLSSAIHQFYDGPKKIYISRRSWIHGDTSNIGTNYTTRRRCENEDEVVQCLEAQGYTEVFCETMSMEEKRRMFQHVTHVVGFIGGGMANLLFSSPQTHVACMVTPEFLTINKRFRFSMDHTHISYLDCTRLASHDGPYPLYIRVRMKGQEGVGEIERYVGNNEYTVKIGKEKVAGFSFQGTFDTIQCQAEDLEPLDKGLNSPFVCDVNRLREWLDSVPK